MKTLILVSLMVLMTACAGKPQQMKFTNTSSHAAVTGLCTAVAIPFLRAFDIPSPWNEIGGAVLCTLAVSTKELRDPVFDWGDVMANGAGATAVGVTFFYWEWE